MNLRQRLIPYFIAVTFLFSGLSASAAEFSASFKGTDIQEFIEIVGRNLEKTIIVDPSVRGTVNVRSYNTLTEAQYYQFFLNVLEVYGFAVVEMDNGVVKVVRDKDAKTSPVPVVGEADNVVGDEVVTRVVAVKNVSVRELSPLLRQLINNAGAGNVVHYDPANVIMITGRAAVVNRLTDIIQRVDQAGDKEVEVVRLEHASAAEMVRIVDALNERDNANTRPELLEPRIVADERLNAVLVSGEPKVRERVKKLIRQLDKEMATTGNSRVIYLRYAKADEVVDVLKGVSDNLLEEKEKKSKPGSTQQTVQISAHQGTNALVITAPPDILKTLESVISQLDIRRAQVLIEALIVEMSESDGANLGVQWGSLENGGIQFNNTGVGVSSYLGGQEATKDRTRTETRIIDGVETPVEVTESGDYSALNEVLGGLNGLAAGVIMGDWTALVTAVASNNESNILSSPNLMVLDNQEASFVVGEEVPVITGSQTGSNNDNPFQTVERKDVGIKLKVTPQINEGSAVLLDIEQEVSNVLGASGAVDVRFGKRQLTTSVMVGDQQMIVLSGLIDERTVESESKVPVLGDIPVLGHLFKSTSTQTEKKNLMLFIKPTIIRTGLTADGVTQRKYNYIRAEQLLRAQDGVKLMPDAEKPVLPDYNSEAVMPAEVRALKAELAG
ncbi:type II secretion system protein GspD [Salinivibrio sp. VYel9]|nr:type II secretion system protein GspD [Salinivibrio sp. VYel7]MPX91757.1 type II secretion system protein GspD [Salinivibrio sp. VYel1]MPX94638.1 type II secretion system protein GspD [Salinivibrio sp. VYel9]MPX97750.1 type II secretion system protein GspD [Salinivibrio sp. VYel6]MPY00966.1 type II secretion system protein GspD [Salinivibrio sp. VYel4]MPY03978.1 type II secretion system protein GspD [Salinivibrio sp. VYel5]MPY06956.1 type II secretion system protein GspD [Salinivibrio sp. 